MKYLSIILFLLFGFTGQPQYKLVKRIPVKASFIATDNLQNLYVVHDNQLSKYDSEGKLQRTYSNQNYGNITSVDVSDPMKILVFYKDFSQMVLLDNMLSENGSPISLSDLGYSQASLVCTSHNSGFWLFDQQNMQLVRLNKNLSVTQQTGNLVQQLGMAVNPDFLVEYNNYVYLNNPATGILVFDIYGTYYKTIPVKGLRRFQLDGDRIIYLKDGKINIYHMQTIDQQTLAAPDTAVVDVNVQKNKLFEQLPGEVRVYDVK